MTVAYLDASALVKLVISEQESGALRDYLTHFQTLVSSKLARVEVTRAVSARVPTRANEVTSALRHLRYVGLDDTILETASELPPSVLRALDAIHIASALALGDALEVFVTYDRRMAEAAEALGIPVVAPA
ncbi:MAG: VapC toxin family PIN domain ribonuclease [Anaerolinea sp.]|nr:VapC toxin family PIN domain ribonuclease [Anaerolinea sp.]